MGTHTEIPWCTATWNPWTGCKKIAPGCKNCYANRDMSRWKKDFSSVTRAAEKTFKAPLSWLQPEVVFTCSWSDFFIDQAEEWATDALYIMSQTPRHTYLVLTKRLDRITGRNRRFTDLIKRMPHVWLGVSVSTQKDLDDVLHHLAVVKSEGISTFISAEPLLENINLTDALPIVDWVITGGESGNSTGEHRYRPVCSCSIRDIVRQCRVAGVPVFVKQLGTELARALPGVKDRHGRVVEEWPEDMQVREVPDGVHELLTREKLTV